MSRKRGDVTGPGNVRKVLGSEAFWDLEGEIRARGQQGGGLPSLDPAPPPPSLSLVIPYSHQGPRLSPAALQGLWKFEAPEAEIILVASGFGFEVPAELEALVRSGRLKFFYYPGDLRESRVAAKGRLEARGKRVLVAGPEEVNRSGFLEPASLWGQARPRSRPPDQHLPRPEKIVYLLLNLALSGGAAVVLQHARWLLAQGYDVSLVDLSGQAPAAWEGLSVPVYPYRGRFHSFLEHTDLAIATHWSTAVFLPSLPARRKMYFVQSDERRFFPEPRFIQRVDATYRLRVEFMTEALWIQRWLQEEFQQQAYYVPNGLDTTLFHPAPPLAPTSARPRILLEGAIDYWYKGMELAYAAVAGLDADLWIVSSQGALKPGWHCQAFFQHVPLQEMKSIYSSCDLLLKMSLVEGFFGPPLEAMACGCAVVVGQVTGYDEYIRDGQNALVVARGDVDGARRAVRRLLQDRELRQRLIANGRQTAAQWSWERSFAHLTAAVEQRPVEKHYQEDFPARYEYENELQFSQKYYQNYLQRRTGRERLRAGLAGVRYHLEQLRRHLADPATAAAYARHLWRQARARLRF